MVDISFSTVINCMDGRVQLPVIKFLQKRFNSAYIDSITEPGPILILSEQKNKILFDSILERVKISIEKHDSKQVAVVSHYDCAGNPSTKEVQLLQLKQSLALLKSHHENIEIIGLWVDEKWQVEEVL